MTIRLLFFSSFFALLSACTVVDDARKQAVTVVTPYVDGANCHFTDSKGEKWYLHRTPGTVTLNKGNAPISVICAKKGYHKNISFLHEHLAEVDFGNFLEGTIGMVSNPYGSIDKEFPNRIDIWLEPKEFATQEAKEKWTKERNQYVAQEKARIAALEQERVEERKRTLDSIRKDRASRRTRR